MKQAKLLIAVVAYGLNWAGFHSIVAEGSFLICGGLLCNVAVAFVAVAEEIGRSLAAEIAIYALIVNVELARYILFPFVVFVCHNGKQTMFTVFSVKQFSPYQDAF